VADGCGRRIERDRIWRGGRGRARGGTWGWRVGFVSTQQFGYNMHNVVLPKREPGTRVRWARNGVAIRHHKTRNTPDGAGLKRQWDNSHSAYIQRREEEQKKRPTLSRTRIGQRPSETSMTEKQRATDDLLHSPAAQDLPHTRVPIGREDGGERDFGPRLDEVEFASRALGLLPLPLPCTHAAGALILRATSSAPAGDIQ
jgi:hypothetical protein